MEKHPGLVSEKSQTPAQRVANAAWLRAQIQQLVADCADQIAEGQRQAHDGRVAQRDAHLARIGTHRHWKRKLERVLRGKTSAEEPRGRIGR